MLTSTLVFHSASVAGQTVIKYQPCGKPRTLTATYSNTLRVNLYLISGLGADERIFQRLTFSNVFKIYYVKWPELDKNETLFTFCAKITKQIDTSQEYGLIGVSFGGIVTIELSKILNPKVSIIISSIATRNEMPIIYRFLGKTGVHKLVPKFTLNKIYPFTYWFFGVSISADKKLLKQIINDTSQSFLKWALNEIFVWNNQSKPSNIFHIHGDRDKLFPIKLTNADAKVQNGGHLMVYTDSDKISTLLHEHLGSR